MRDGPMNIDVEKLLSYCDDLVTLLRDKRDINNLTQCREQAKSIQFTVDADFTDFESSIRDYQKKIDDCKHKIEEANSDVIADEEIDQLQRELDSLQQRERLLEEELRVIEEKIDELDQQRLSIEEQRQNLKNVEQDYLKAETKLSFYASVTSIIPDLEIQSKICGQIVERDKNVIQKFEFDQSYQQSFDICNSLWKMIDS